MPSEDPIERLVNALAGFFSRPQASLLVVIVLVGAWFSSGLYTVDPGEQGVVRRFGKEIAKTSAGLNYRLPWPLERVDIVNVERVRRLEVGFRTMRGGQIMRVPEESHMLTDDENIVEAQIIVQYQVKDPSKYLFRLKNPEESLLIATEVALRGTVGGTTIDEAMTVGRTKIQDDTRKFLQRLMDTYQSGLSVTEVKLQVVDPPDAVKDAFHEVVRAREDREKLINQARGYREDVIPRARGQGQKMIREAEAYREERILRAKGDTTRFLAVLAEYRKAKQVTRDRLYLEMMERTLPKTGKAVVDPRASSGVLPFLPLAAGGQGGGKIPVPGSEEGALSRGTR